MSIKEKDIKNFAQKIAKQVRKPASTIKMPFTKEIPYEVEKSVPVTEGFFIFKTTRMEKVKEQRTRTSVDYNEVQIDGWVLKTYYMNVDTVVASRRLEQEVSKWFYVLKKDGSLSVLELGYTIEAPRTNSERVTIFHELSEEPMTFDYDRAGLGSAYLLDFKPVKWELSHKKGFNEILYFKRNYPTQVGKHEWEGESELIQEPGTGIMAALKKLERRNSKK